MSEKNTTIELSELPKGKYGQVKVSHGKDAMDGEAILKTLNEAKGHLAKLDSKMPLSKPDNPVLAQVFSGAKEGVHVYSPPGSHSRMSLELTAPTLSALQRNIIVVDAGSRLTLDLTLRSLNDSPGFVGQRTDVFVREGAELTLNELQDLNKSTLHAASAQVYLSKDSTLHWNSITLGGAKAMVYRGVELAGKGAEATDTEIVFGGGGQQMAFDTAVTHSAPNTKSHVMFKGLVSGTSRVLAEGMARIRHSAPNSVSRVDEHALLLDPGAKCDTIPGLEIENNEVSCSHSASVTKIDPEQLFYLSCRGLQREQAREAIALGFLQDGLKPLRQHRMHGVVEGALRAQWSNKVKGGDER